MYAIIILTTENRPKVRKKVYFIGSHDILFINNYYVDADVTLMLMIVIRPIPIYRYQNLPGV